MTKCESLINLVLRTLIVMLVSFIVMLKCLVFKIKVLYDYESLE
jgi:hypothetical protein